MRNLKKRILSFVSAVAMVATLLPSTALFASADSTSTETFAIDQSDESTVLATNIEGATGNAKTERGKTFLDAGGGSMSAYGISFVVPSGLTASDTIKVDIYAAGQGDPKVRLWDSNKIKVDNTDVALTSGDWDAKDKPTTQTFTGDKLTAGTYYAGVEANEYINLWKIVVTITTNGSTGGDSGTDPSSETKTTETKKISSSSYTGLTFSDGGTCNVVPIVLNENRTGDVKVKITSGGGSWANVFGPDAAVDGWGTSPASAEGGKAVSFDFTTLCFNNGATEFTIPANKAAGTYYIGVSGSSNITVDVTYNTGDVSEYSTGGETGDGFTVSATANSNGSVRITDAEGKEITSGSKVISGTTVTFTATPDSGYNFSGWSDKTTAASYEVTVTADTTLTAYFAKDVVIDEAKFHELPVISIATPEVGDPTAGKAVPSDATWENPFPSTCGKSSAYKNSTVQVLNAGANNYEARAQIKGRGNSTWNLEKRPFQLSFDKSVNLLKQGANANKKWILLANHIDRTLLRNQVTLTWAKSALTNIPFTSSSQQVEVYLNGEYQGVYLLVEQSEAKTGRVTATEPKAATETTEATPVDLDNYGFLVELDQQATNNTDPSASNYECGFTVEGQNYVIKSGVLDEDDVNDPYKAPIKEYIKQVHNAIVNDGSQESIEALVDINSAVDMFILQEFVKNVDVGGGSFYMSKEKGKKLVFNPPWDFDRAYGVDVRGITSSGLYCSDGADDGDNSNQNTWLNALWKHSWFKNLVGTRWHQLRSDSTTDPVTSANATIDNFVNNAPNAINANFTEWSTILTKKYEWYGGGYGQYYGDTQPKGSHSAEVNYLKTWISERATYLDSAFVYTEPDTNTYETVNALVDGSYNPNAIWSGRTNDDSNCINLGTGSDSPYAYLPITIPAGFANGDTVKVIINGGTQGSNNKVGVYKNNSGAVGDAIMEATPASGWASDNTITLTVGTDVEAGKTYFAGIKAYEYINLVYVKVQQPSTSTTSHTLNIQHSGTGTVSQGSTDVTDKNLTVAENGTVTLTATAGTGYKFSKWEYSNVTLASGSSETNATATFTMGSADGYVKAIFVEDSTEVTTKTMTLKASDYSEYTYEDNGTNVAIPFIVNNTDSAITITVPVTNAGDNTWANVFGPSDAGITWSATGTNGNESADGVSKTFDAVQKYYNQVTGEVTVTIPAGAPTGTYYIGVTNGNLDSITIEYVDGAVEAVSTKTQYTITATASPTEGGTVTGAGKYDVDTAITLTATPNDGYKFVKWTDAEGTELATTPDYGVTVTADASYIAVFEVVTYTVSVVSSSDAIGTAEATLVSSNTYTLTATPAEGYRFVNWTDANGNVVGTSATMTYTAKSDITLTANFDDKFVTITTVVNNSDYGTVTLTANDTEVADGKVEVDSSVTITATPADGYKFLRWVDANNEFVSNVATYSFTASSDATYKAEFEKIPDPPEGGEVTKTDTLKIEAESYSYITGDITIIENSSASDGKCIQNGSSNGVEGEAFLPITLPEGATYTIKVVSDNDGYPGSSEDWHRNQWVNLYSTTGTGDSTEYNGTTYKKADYKQTSAHNDFGEDTVFTDVQPGDYVIGLYGQSHSLYDYIEIVASSAVFGDSGAAVTVTPSCNEDFGTVSAATTVAYGSTATVTATAADDYRFVSWTKDGKVVSKDAKYTFTAYEDTALVANFGKIEWIILEAENFTEFQTENQNASGETDRIWDVTDVQADVTAELPNADYKKYTDTMFSGGQAVNLTKNSSAVGIPFTVTDQAINYGDLDVILGYDWGNMDENHTDASGSESGLWVNIYVPLNGESTMSDTDKAIWGAAGWRTDGGSLATSSSYAEGYYILYRRLDPNKTEMTVTIPHKADPGNYILAVATDTWNGSQTSITGTGYYDYIKFPAGTNEGIVVGATFFFTDMFGNTLRSSEYSDTTFEGTTVYFSPKVPRYILTQGYDIVRWEYTDPDGNSAVIDLTNTDFDSPSAAIEALKYPAGSNVTFKAVYEVAEGAYDVSVKNGRMYVMDPDTQEYTVELEKSNTYKVANFGQIKLVADTKANEEFDHWELNGFIYSYDKEIMFSTWTHANFEAVYKTATSTAQPVAFVDENVVVNGFETEDKNLHKITFDCAYYVPDGYSAYKIGIYYSGDPGKANLEALAGTTVKLSGAPTTPTKCARLDINYNMLVNNQSMVSLYATPSYKNRSALAFIIYTDSNGDYYITYSGRVATSDVPMA